MSTHKTLLSLAVAAGLGAVSFQASAAAPTVYGDLAITALYTGSNTDATGVDGSESSYGLYDDVSLLGVKGDLGEVDGTKFFYDFNFILNITDSYIPGLPFTHLSILGAEGGFGTFTVGLRDNGLFENWVDGAAYLTNWFYTPGMSALQVSNAIKYVTPTMGGFQLGVQAFDFGKDSVSGESTTNYTVAGTFATGGLSFGLGYTDYSKYADGTLGGFSSDPNMFGESTNTFAGIALESTTGASVTWKGDKFALVGAYDMRSPYAYTGNTNTDSIDTLMLTGSYSMTEKWTVVANYSDTSQSSDGVKGTIWTAMLSYAPNDSVFYSLELQSSDEDANVSGLTGATGVATGAGAKSSTALALSAIYTF